MINLKSIKWVLSILAVLTLLISPAPVISATPANTTPGVPGAAAEEIPLKEVCKVTLITGDVVTVMTGSDGQKSFAISPADPAKLGQNFLTIREGKNTYIIPDGVDLKKLDRELFNIDYLTNEEYYKNPSLPLLISYTPGLPKLQMQTLEGKLKAVGQKTELHASVQTFSTQLDYKNVSASYSNLMNQPEVKKVWLDRKVHARLDDSVPLIGAPWWWNNTGNRGQGIKIAILDTGIDSTHPALDDLDDNSTTNDPKVIVNRNFSDDAGYNDLYGHGTHCAGIAAGTAAGSPYQGVAPGAYLWNVKVLNQYGSGWSSWIINGLDFASLGPDGVPHTGDEADVISMSLGDGQSDGTDPLSQAVNIAVDRGVVVVVAAGNSGPSPQTVSTPGTADKAITVAATDKSDILAGFSSRGPTLGWKLKPDISAPGVDIVSSVSTNPACYINDPSGYRPLSGTSMATPHVAGAAALLRQHFGAAASPQFIKDALMCTATDPGYNVYEQGSGRLNLAWDPRPAVGLTPASSSLGSFTTEPSDNFTVTFFTDNTSSHDVNLSVRLTDTITDNDYSSSVSVDQHSFTVPADGLVQVNLAVDLSTLPRSTYDGRLSATVDNGTVMAVHAIFGFVKSATVTVHKIDINGNPAANHNLWILSESQPTISGYTDVSGNFTFDALSGTYQILSTGVDNVNDASIWTIAEDVNVTGDMLIPLDERDTRVVNFDPNDDIVQKPAGKASTLVYFAGNYAVVFGSSWYYPASFINRVSPCIHGDLSFTYACYPVTDFKPQSPELVNSNTWYNLNYRSTGITGETTFTADHANLVHRDSGYRLALYEERTQVSQTAIGGWLSYSFSYFMDAPRQRWEWLTPGVSYIQSYSRYMSAQGNCWRFDGSSSYPNAGEYSYDMGGHPLSPGVKSIGISWNEPDNQLYINGALFRDSYGNQFQNSCAGSSPGHITLSQDGNPVLDTDITDNFGQQVSFSGRPHFTIEVRGQITLDPKGQTRLPLSGTSVSRLNFVADPAYSDYLPPQLLFRVPGIALSGVVANGQVNVDMRVTDASGISSLSLYYSQDGGATWNEASLTSLQGGWYIFNLGQLQDRFISLAAEATDEMGNHIRHETISAFRVGITLPSVITTPATNITSTTATLNGNLAADGGATDNVTVYWGTTDGITTPGNWGHNVPLGPKAIGAFSTDIIGLSTGTTYYYRCSATNSAGTAWAESSSPFTPSVALPTITNASGATSIMATTAILNGSLTSTGGLETTVHICGGKTEHGTIPAEWDFDENLGIRATGPFSISVTGLTPSTTYYYSCYASNSAGTSWAVQSSHFVTQVPLGVWKNYWAGPGKDSFWYSSGGPK